MGGGRKTQTIIIGEASASMSGSSFVRSRNLHKGDLGGMIFGCKHNTMTECLSKQLFGLPSPHFSYVRNVKPALPLFLFNYSDRKLHGIYEAASQGKMNIDPYAWTDGGAERTPFPAQVRIRIKTPCQPLLENQFRDIIEDNFFNKYQFWFELDHTQTRKLLASFIPSPTNNVLNTGAINGGNGDLLTALPTIKQKSTSNTIHDYSNISGLKENFKLDAEMTSGHKLASLGWDEGDNENETSSVAPEDTELREPVSDWEELVEENLLKNHLGVPFNTSVDDKTLLGLMSTERGFHNELENLSANQCLNSCPMCCKNNYVNPLDFTKLQEHSPEETSGLLTEEMDAIASNLLHSNYEPVQIKLSEEMPVLTEEEGILTSDISHGTVKLVQVIQELKEQTRYLERKQVESKQQIQQLQDIVKHSERKIEQLKDCVKELECKIDPSMALVDDSLDKFVEQYFGSDKVIYLIGGFNGSSWLSALDSLSPSLDILTPLKPMSSARSYASAAALHGNLYVFGGGESGDGSLWYRTVECYNPSHDEWAVCPSMRCEKGNLAVATFNGKIYAIGGGTGKDCFSDVEMFDPALGRWINTQPMIEKRFALAAAELHGTLYAVGGYDRKSYLNSAERYDLREPFWCRLPNMKSRRACHSLAAFNEKLYAIGGYDSQRMVSSVEIFDPRMNSWVMGESLRFNRGYAASMVLDDSLLVVGGVKDDDNIVETVESYREGIGWNISNLKAIGKRCFFPAIVL